MYCPKCHAERPETGRFCSNCGTELVPFGRSAKKYHWPVVLLSVLCIVCAALLVVLTVYLVGGEWGFLPFAEDQELTAVENVGAQTETSSGTEDGTAALPDTTEDAGQDASGKPEETDETLTGEEETTANSGDDLECDIPESGTLEYGGHTYYVFDGSVGVTSWEEAQLYCEQRGGYLAVINDQEENDALHEYACGGRHTCAFFGYSDSISEDVWEWVDGDSSSYENWGVNALGEQQPNSDSHKEDYAEFSYEDGTWNDSEFGYDTTRFICEWNTVRSEES
ncbi:MAG TPA: hypothetical protein IAC15_06635 [Candidatus Onthomonas avicola]|nr:hypothetical protein [Candidatus Onthomonas avicola]